MAEKSDIFASIRITVEIDHFNTTAAVSLKVTLSHAVVGLSSKVRMHAHNVYKWWRVKCVSKSAHAHRR
jgi:hypothetical protein